MLSNQVRVFQPLNMFELPTFSITDLAFMRFTCTTTLSIFSAVISALLLAHDILQHPSAGSKNCRENGMTISLEPA